MVAGCGSGTGKPAPARPSPPPKPAEPSATLTIAYYPHGHQRPAGGHTWRLRCGPPGGTHPAAAAACRELSAHPGALGPARRPCIRALTRLGAPEAFVTGRVARRPVNRELRPACEPAAWAALQALLTGRG